jgi:hypothetical protein
MKFYIWGLPTFVHKCLFWKGTTKGAHYIKTCTRLWAKKCQGGESPSHLGHHDYFGYLDNPQAAQPRNRKYVITQQNTPPTQSSLTLIIFSFKLFVPRNFQV